MGEALCRNCLYWLPDIKATQLRQADWGACRRNSPRLQMSRHSDDTAGIWPPTSATDWCGEFKPANLDLFHTSTSEMSK